jgi:hypothetical protein
MSLLGNSQSHVFALCFSCLIRENLCNEPRRAHQVKPNSKDVGLIVLESDRSMIRLKWFSAKRIGVKLTFRGLVDRVAPLCA